MQGIAVVLVIIVDTKVQQVFEPVQLYVSQKVKVSRKRVAKRTTGWQGSENINAGGRKCKIDRVSPKQAIEHYALNKHPLAVIG